MPPAYRPTPPGWLPVHGVNPTPYRDVVDAEPVPGVTGLNGPLLAYRTGRVPVTEINFNPTPGAAEGSEKMLQGLRAVGAKAISQISLLLPDIEQDNLLSMTLPFLRSPDPAAVESLLGTLADDRGFSLGSLFNGAANFEFGDGSVRKVLQGFTNEILTAMHVGAYNEDWRALPGVPLTSEPTLAIFNFFDLTQLTRDFVTDPKLQHTLLRSLAWRMVRRPETETSRRGGSMRYIGLLIKFRGSRSRWLTPTR